MKEGKFRITVICESQEEAIHKINSMSGDLLTNIWTFRKIPYKVDKFCSNFHGHKHFRRRNFHFFRALVSMPNSLFIGPRITGGRPRYQIGDIVRVNCSSGRSKPAAHLNWYINGEPADQSQLHSYETVITGREGLETSILGLEFRVKPRHFRRGDMKLKVKTKSVLIKIIETNWVLW